MWSMILPESHSMSAGRRPEKLGYQQSTVRVLVGTTRRLVPITNAGIKSPKRSVLYITKTSSPQASDHDVQRSLQCLVALKNLFSLHYYIHYIYIHFNSSFVSHISIFQLTFIILSAQSRNHKTKYPIQLPTCVCGL